jgi:DNA-binding Lrp family transcriptional regulator
MPTNRRDTQPVVLDALDLRLLALLRDNARAQIVALARELHLGHATVHARLARLEREGYVLGYHARLDYERLGLKTTAHLGLQIQQSGLSRARLVARLREMAEVEDFAWLTGDIDVLVRVRVRDAQHLEEVLFRLIDAAGGQVRTRTMVQLSEPFWKPGPDFEQILGAQVDGGGQRQNAIE